MRYYTVRKKIKGRLYLYRQRTWREGGKVRTESHYVGPYEGSHAQIKDKAQQSFDAQQRIIKKVVADQQQAREAAQNRVPVDEVGDERVNTTGSRLKRWGAWLSAYRTFGSWLALRRTIRRYRKVGLDGAREIERKYADYLLRAAAQQEKGKRTKQKRKVTYWRREADRTITALVHVRHCIKILELGS